MKNEIDKYVDSIYQELGQSKDLMELKEEMRNHLLETAMNLKSAGYSDEESVQLAIERFGDQETLSKGINSLYEKPAESIAKTKRDIRAWLSLLLACISLVLMPIYAPFVFPFSVAAFVLGIISRKGVNKGIALSGIILSILAVVLTLISMFLLMSYLTVNLKH